MKLSYSIDFDKETLTKNLKLQLANHILYTKVNNNEYYVNSFMYTVLIITCVCEFIFIGVERGHAMCYFVKQLKSMQNISKSVNIYKYWVKISFQENDWICLLVRWKLRPVLTEYNYIKGPWKK